MRNEPSFFFTNNTGAPYGDVLGLMNPFANSSSSCFLSSSNSAMERRMTGRTGGSAFGSVSIFIASPRSSGNPAGRVEGNTSANSSLTIDLMSGCNVKDEVLSFSFFNFTIAKNTSAPGCDAAV